MRKFEGKKDLSKEVMSKNLIFVRVFRSRSERKRAAWMSFDTSTMASIPKSLPEMQRLWQALERRGRFSRNLTSRLMPALLEAGKREECVEVIRKAAEKNFKPRLEVHTSRKTRF